MISSKFEEARLETLKKWKQVIRLPENQFKAGVFEGENLNSIECGWQKRARENGYRHINLFCSLAAWADNITDLLTETRYDELEFQFLFGGAKTLSRYYIRFYLMASEYLNDFCEINRIVFGRKQLDTKGSRKELSRSGKFEVHDFIEFTNRVIKHKVKEFHKCNHHFLYLYGDNKIIPQETVTPKPDEILQMGQLHKFATAQYIYFPKLIEIVEAIEFCYSKLTLAFNDNNKFIKICEEFKTLKA